MVTPGGRLLAEYVYGEVPPEVELESTRVKVLPCERVLLPGFNARSETCQANTVVETLTLLASATVTVMLLVSLLVAGAVPLITPMLEFIVSQLGRPDAEYVYG